MKHIIRLFVFLFVTLGVALAADAVVVTADTGGITASNLVLWLTPVIVPLVIALVKKFQPQIPSWVLPLAAPVLGVVIDVINSYALGQANNLIVAALLGLAGVGVREIKDQLTPTKPTP
jgi:hypothetical protein